MKVSRWRCPEEVPARPNVWRQRDSPNTMRRVCVSVEPSGFWAVQRNMEPLSSAGTLSRTSSLPTNSSLPSSKRPPTLDQVNMGSGNTSVCGRTKTEKLLMYELSPQSCNWKRDGTYSRRSQLEALDSHVHRVLYLGMAGGHGQLGTPGSS